MQHLCMVPAEATHITLSFVVLMHADHVQSELSARASCNSSYLTCTQAPGQSGTPVCMAAYNRHALMPGLKIPDT
jgi:hypothetical protein